jgi:hypothetical protein
VEIISSENPKMKNREFLMDAVIESSAIQVLILDPEPHDDPTQIRGHCGVTGELKQHLLSIFESSESLKKIFDYISQPVEYEILYNELLYLYRFRGADMNIYGALRLIFNDCFDPASEDWLRPCYASMCAYSENNYRNHVGLPSALSDDPDDNLTGLKYSTYLNFVMNGFDRPDLEWESRYPEIENPKRIWFP